MKNTRIWWPVAVVLGVALTACGAVDEPEGNPATPSDDDDDDDDTEGFGTVGPGTPTGGDDQDSNDDDDDDDPGGGDSDTGCMFVCPDDAPSGAFECDMFAQDCPEGEKCMPWVNDGGNAWNATRCSPIADNPGQPGDECSVEGSAGSGIDDCDAASMCWSVDPETGMGTCVAMCAGDESNPLCEDPATTCVNVNDGAIVLCLPACDPLLQDCPDSEACYIVPSGDFACAQDVSGEMGVYGDPCGSINSCDPGLVCGAASLVPACQGSPFCCTEFCDLEDPNGDAQCSGQGGGQECIAISADPQPGYEAVGWCALPA